MSRYFAERRVEKVLDAVDINDGEAWNYEMLTTSCGVKFRLCCELADTTDAGDAKTEQCGRWWHVEDSEAADESHILRTAWLAYQTFMHHEMLERFSYRGSLPFNPHTEITS